MISLEREKKSTSMGCIYIVSETAGVNLPAQFDILGVLKILLLIRSVNLYACCTRTYILFSSTIHCYIVD